MVQLACWQTSQVEVAAACRSSPDAAGGGVKVGRVGSEPIEP